MNAHDLNQQIAEAKERLECHRKAMRNLEDSLTWRAGAHAMRAKIVEQILEKSRQMEKDGHVNDAALWNEASYLASVIPLPDYEPEAPK